MWKLVIVFAFGDPNWPPEQPAPMIEIVRSYDSLETCERFASYWFETPDARMPGMDKRWFVLLANCEASGENIA